MDSRFVDELFVRLRERGYRARMVSISHLQQLKKGGELIILDHFNPGDAPVSFKLSEELRRKLREFQSKFKPRKIIYYDIAEGWIKTSMRDFCDFVTKIWALNSGLEEEEKDKTLPQALELIRIFECKTIFLCLPIVQWRYLQCLLSLHRKLCRALDFFV